MSRLRPRNWPDAVIALKAYGEYVRFMYRRRAPSSYQPTRQTLDRLAHPDLYNNENTSCSESSPSSR